MAGPVGEVVRAYAPSTAARIAGASVRQVEYWAETGLVEPSVERRVGRRVIRLFGFGDVVELRVVAQLRGKNVSLQAVRAIVQLVRERDGIDRPLSQLQFAVERGSGRLVWIDPDGTAEQAKRPGQTLFVDTLDLAEIRRSVRSFKIRAAEDEGATERRRGRLGNKEVFAGTRTPVEALRPYISRGYETSRILQAFPHLTEADVSAARAMLAAAS